MVSQASAKIAGGRAALLLILLVAVSSACARRQTTARAVPDTPPANRISLQDTGAQEPLSEWAVPQIEQEKAADYRFNQADNLFDLTFEGADLRATLQSMCDMQGYNLVMDAGINDSVTVNLKNVTFFKFLDVALDSKRMTYRLEENFLYVNARGLETRIYHLNYLNTVRQVNGTMNIAGQGGGASGGLIPQSTTTLQTQNTVNIWSDIRNSLAGIVLGQGQQQTAALTAEASYAGTDEATGHRLVVEPNSGVVQVTARPDVLDEVDRFLSALESSLQRQVLIEARFVEINLSNNFAAGLDWSLIPDLASLSGALSGGAAVRQSLSPGGGDFQVGVANNNISAILEAISRHGKVNVLQSPQVSTLNNQPAVIRVARNETFFQRQEIPGNPATATSAATLPAVNYIPVQQPTGVVLNLTPQIGDDGLIIMSIRPSITSIAAVATSPDGLSTSPITDVRELDTVAKVRHGQTVILAGLIQERENEDISETPVLGRLPILGNLFRQVQKGREKVELVILLTPYINYSRPSEELSEGQLRRYKEVAKSYDFGQEQFNHR